MKALIVVFVPAAAAFAASRAVYAWTASPSRDLFFNTYVYVIPALHLLGTGLVWGFLRQGGRSMRPMIGFARERLGRDLAMALGLTVAQFAIILLFNTAWGRFWPVVATPELATGPAYFRLVVVAATAGFGEEVIWRGYGQTTLMEATGSRSAGVLIASVGFALFHVNPFSVAGAFVNGLFYALVYLRVGRLFPIMLSHWLTDFLIFLAPLVG